MSVSQHEHIGPFLAMEVIEAQVPNDLLMCVKCNLNLTDSKSKLVKYCEYCGEEIKWVQTFRTINNYWYRVAKMLGVNEDLFTCYEYNSSYKDSDGILWQILLPNSTEVCSQSCLNTEYGDAAYLPVPTELQQTEAICKFKKYYDSVLHDLDRMQIRYKIKYGYIKYFM
jgi:predicted RNA-binding Zn-ribbon protein involved in translation (DUF1610 family)